MSVPGVQTAQPRASLIAASTALTPSVVFERAGAAPVPVPASGLTPFGAITLGPAAQLRTQKAA